MAENSDIPPLEDMSDLLDKAQFIREQKAKKSSQNKTVVTNGHCETKNSTANTKQPSEKSSSSQSTVKEQSKDNVQPPPPSSSTKSSGFGGLKKGFMFGGSTTKPKAKPKEESVPYIKKNEEALKLDEVQQAMSDTITKKKDEWMTDDLLTNIEKNETLAKKLQDPRFMEAVNMFQTNPTEAMERYKNDKETQDAFMQFCGLMGNHFTNIADKDGKQEEKVKNAPKIIEEIDPSDTNKYVPSKPPSASERGTILTRQSHESADMSVRSSTNPHQPTADDEKKMQDIMSRPEIMEVLIDPWVQNLLNVLRTNPDSGQRILKEADDEKKKKLKKLVDVGLLQFQT